MSRGLVDFRLEEDYKGIPTIYINDEEIDNIKEINIRYEFGKRAEVTLKLVAESVFIAKEDW